MLFVVHGGSDEQDAAHTFDSALQFFQYDPNSVIFRNIIWNPQAWPGVLSAGDSQAYANTATQLKKYNFEYARLGGTDPAPQLVERQFGDMTRELERLGKARDLEFVTDIAQWIGTQEQANRLPWPRYLYRPQVAGGAPLTYCGSKADGGPWPGCDPQRYDVDGPGERLLKQGATELVMIDMTVGGVRFWKTYDVVQMTRRMVGDWNRRNGTSIGVRWANDPTDLMADSYPLDPPNWTRSLGPPRADARVPLDGRPNPVILDPLLTAMAVDGIVASFNPQVAPRDTAVLFINHATRDGNETFDPKIDDTLVLDALIKQELLRRYPQISPANIVGAWMGVKEPGGEIKNGRAKKERTRAMRGEDLGSAWLYESDKQLPRGDHQYRYWDALELLKNQGAKHIVVIFSQIVIDSVLSLVEVPNQIAKEIGRQTWLFAGKGDRRTYPATGHPFAPYWGNWVETQCRAENQDPPASAPCCFTMGGCGDGRPYPPPRQAPISVALQDTDPSLAFDIPAYGHLGYDPAKGPPGESGPVQNQYTGTWAMWLPPNKDPRMGELLARQVVALLDAGREQSGTATAR